MPVQSTHERRQASRRGLDGSDGSGWALLATREEVRRRSEQVREHLGDSLGFRHRHCGADKASHRTEGRTQVALVGAASMVVTGPIGVAVATVIVVGNNLVSMVVARSDQVVTIGVLHQLSFRLNPELPNRAQHAGRERTSNGEEHCEQHEEPEAEGLHSS